MPVSLYSCETLVFLKLFEVTLNDAGFVSLPCLKTMHLEELCYPNDATFERLVSGCPVLEELKILGCMSVLQLFRGHSLSLKRLEIQLFLDTNITNNQVVIDAPLLHCLKINDSESGSYIVNNLDSSAKLDIDLSFCVDKFDEEIVSSRRNSIRDFLPGISKVREMIIHLTTFKVFHLYSKLEPLPQFHCMSHLDATFCPSNIEWLPTFLECCPNLKSLVLASDEYKFNPEDMNQISFSFVPECLVSSLKSVDIKCSIWGYAAEMKLVRYLLENSIILKKLTVRLFPANEHVRLKKLLKIPNENVILKKIPRRSITCQVVVL